MKRLSYILALCGVGCAWGIDIPRVGFMRDAQGRVIAVNGLAGNFVLDDTAAVAETATAFAWNGSYGIRKTESSLEWWDASGTRVAAVDAPTGDVVFGLGADTAYVFSKSTRTLFQWRSTQWSVQQVPVGVATPEDEVLALTGDRDSVTLALRRNGTLAIAAFDIRSGSRLPEIVLARSASHVLFLNDGGIAGLDGSTFWIQRADGSGWSADTGSTLVGLTWMGREWVHATAEDRGFAVRIRAGRDPEIYLLPSVEPHASARGATRDPAVSPLPDGRGSFKGRLARGSE